MTVQNGSADLVEHFAGAWFHGVDAAVLGPRQVLSPRWTSTASFPDPAPTLETPAYVVCRDPMDSATDRRRSTYLLDDAASERALAAIRSLALEPSEGRIRAFVADFGPLIRFSHWLSMLGIGSRSPIGASVSLGGVFGFAAWCEETGRADVVRFMAAASEEVALVSRKVAWDHPLAGYNAPAAFYVWVAQSIDRLASELALPELSLQSRDFLDDRLHEVSLNYDAAKRAIELQPHHLLAALGLRCALSGEGLIATERACRNCGTIFTLRDPRQIFHSEQCRWAYQAKARRARARAARQRKAHESKEG